MVSSAPFKNRPRIPTPDVTKEGIEKENRFNLMPVTSIGSSATAPPGASNIAQGVALAARKLATEPSIYPTHIDDKQPFGTLILSPIKESDSGSVNNTLQPNSPSTVELARAVLPAALQAASFGNIATTTGKINIILMEMKYVASMLTHVFVNVS